MKITKKDIWKQISRTYKGYINSYHIYSVLNILLDEIIKDLKSGKQIKIKNFGTLKLKEIGSKEIYNVSTGKKIKAKHTNSLRLSLSENFKKWLKRDNDEKNND